MFARFFNTGFDAMGRLKRIGTSLAQYVADIAIRDGMITAPSMMMNEEEPRTITHHE
jgi:hypothetical protein